MSRPSRTTSGITLEGEGAPKALQDLARHQMIVKLEKDILMDMRICEIEGWDKMEYLIELKELIDGFFKQTDYPTEWCENCELWRDNNCKGVAECKRNIEMLTELNKLYEADTPQTERNE